VKPLTSNSDAFLSSDELQLRTQADARQRHREWESLRESRKRDPSLIVYFAFQPDAQSDRTIANEAASKLSGSDGTLVGCQWTSGRWPGKQALDFRQVSDRVRLKIPGDFDALTMAVSVRVDALPNKFNSLLMSDSWDEFEGHWHIDSKGTFELGVQGPSRKNWVHYHAPSRFKTDLLGRWTHVAVVYDRADRQVSQYVNGEMISTLPMDLDVPLHIGDCEIGNWNPTTRPHRNPVRFLSGRIDEFLVYSRALSKDEIAQLAGVDQSQPSRGP
jgi:hypothetical protein